MNFPARSLEKALLSEVAVRLSQCGILGLSGRVEALVAICLAAITSHPLRAQIPEQTVFARLYWIVLEKPDS